MVRASQLLARLESFGTRLGLDRTRELLRRCGDPQDGLAIVLVAGTNGKGSTAALLASILTAAGYRTGLYTSPHLESVRERLRVDGVAIGNAVLSRTLEAVLVAGDGNGDGEEEATPTYFEALTVTALLHFAHADVDIAVLEVGLGGRLDATNATEPVLSLISEIGLDHQEHLGASLAEIAVEKAGILRSGRPALGWVSEVEARDALAARAAEIGATFGFVNSEDATGARAPVDAESTALSIRLPGAHQRANLALAVSGARLLGSNGWSRIDAEAIRSGVAGCRWPGRLEWVDLGERGRVLLDGAHNPLAAAALAAYLKDRPKGYTLLYGALEDKRSESMLPLLAGCAEQILLTRVPSARTEKPEALARLLPERRARIVDRPSDALVAEVLESGPLVVCGSLYLVGEVRAELRRRFGVPLPAAEVHTSKASD